MAIYFSNIFFQVILRNLINGSNLSKLHTILIDFCSNLQNEKGNLKRKDVGKYFKFRSDNDESRMDFLRLFGTCLRLCSRGLVTLLNTEVTYYNFKLTRVISKYNLWMYVRFINKHNLYHL